MYRLALEFLIATVIVVAIMVLDTAIVPPRRQPRLTQALLVTGTAAASIGCRSSFVTLGLFASGGDHGQ